MPNSIKTPAAEINEIQQLLADQGLRLKPAQVGALIEFVDDAGDLEEAQQLLATLSAVSAKAA